MYYNKREFTTTEDKSDSWKRTYTIIANKPTDIASVRSPILILIRLNNKIGLFL